MDKLKKNKNAVVIILILILVLIAGGIYAATKDTDKHNKAKTATQSEEKVKKAKEDKKEQKEAEKALEEAKASGDEKAIKEAEAKVEKAQAKIKAGSSAGGSTQNSSAPGEANKKKVWVVDKQAWVEEIRQPVYVPTWWIKFTDGSMKTYYDEDGWYNDCKHTPNVASWGNGEDVPDPSGATQVVGTVNHPEEGHWEYR
ncbi:MAG: hypothetical protein PUK21_03980 [Peptostreptococcaceae bacterium]|nr:hypothetical protein [Peptostreptococcaceae bacterium]MDY5739400.1 hypothetical protein [Anaerovoracaceae bacterium]